VVTAPASAAIPAASTASTPAGLDGVRTGGTRTDGSPRLPQRTRQASLSPHLRDSAEPAAEAADDRSPEQARALASSLQTGWRRGRQDDPANAAFPPSPWQDPTAANGEEA